MQPIKPVRSIKQLASRFEDSARAGAYDASVEGLGRQILRLEIELLLRTMKYELENGVADYV